VHQQGKAVAVGITVAELDEDPYPIYAKWRAEQPVVWVEWAKAFFVTRWQDVKQLAADPETFSARVESSPLTKAIGPNMLHSEGEQHRRLRKPLTKRLRPAALAEGIVDRMVQEATQALEAGQEVDLITEFAQPVAVRVLTEVTGLPEMPEMPEMPEAEVLGWLNGIAAGASNYEGDEGKNQQAAEAGHQVDVMLRRRLNQGPPEGSVLAALVAAGATFSEIVATVKLLLVGGIQEPRDLFGFAMGAYVERPEIREQVRNNEAALVEEALRWGSPVGTVTRRVTKPTQLSGVDIPKNALVAGVLSSANRDERRWERPDEFDIGRKDLQHIAFNAGPHACVGAGLARLEVRLAVRRLVERFPDMTLQEPTTLRGWEFRGPVALKVKLNPR
jgi:cytochrome P450